MNDLDVARQAILNEEEGAAFYASAAEKANDPNVKEAFLYLKDQELQHAKWIRSLYDHLVLAASSTNLEWGTLAEIEANIRAEHNKRGKSPKIFKEDDPAFKMAVMEIAVFAAGKLMEEESIAFYEKAARETESQEAKKLYLALVDWEKEHLEELTTIHEGLRKLWLEQFEFYYSPKL